METPFQISVNKICLKHDEDLNFYCSLHDEILCRNCVKMGHQKCSPQISVSEIATKSKTSVSANLESNFKIMTENLKIALDHQRHTLSNMGEKEAEARNQIHNIRIRFNKKLDELEKHLLKTYTEKRETIVPTIKENIVTLEKKEKEIVLIITNTTKIKEFGSDIDYFLAARQVTQKLLDEEDTVTTTFEKLRGVNAYFTLNSDIEQFVSKLNKIGDVFVEEVPCSINMKSLIGEKKRSTEKERQYTPIPEGKKVHVDKDEKGTPGDEGDIFKLKFVLKTKFEMTKGFLKKDLRICNGTIMKDQIVFTDRENKRFIMTSLTGEHLNNMEVTGRPWGIAKIDESRLVVVTFPYVGSGYIEILDIMNNKVEKPISIGGLCRGIAYYEGFIYVVVYGKGISIVDLEGDVKTEIPINVNGVFHLTVNADRMYYTDEWTHTLHCCDLKGKEIWRFSGDRVREPQGIATDENGNVYVTSYLFDNVTVISPDGKQHREILNKSDGLLGPSSIYYDNRKKYLMVSSREHGRVTIFHVLI